MVATYALNLDLSRPNEITEAFLTCKRAAIVNEVAYPHAIVACNSAWNKLCGWSAEEALGASPKILQGECTNCHKATEFSRRASTNDCASVTLVNYTKHGKPFVHRIHTSRVKDLAGTEYFFTQSEKVENRALIRAMLKGQSSTFMNGSLLILMQAIAALLLMCAFVWCDSVALQINGVATPVHATATPSFDMSSRSIWGFAILGAPFG